MNQSKRNYIVDAAIGVAFLVAGVTAVAFLVPLSWIDWSAATTPRLLGLNYGIWQLLHKWAGIVMMVGVVVHLVLHAKWIANMTGRVFKRDKQENAS